MVKKVWFCTCFHRFPQERRHGRRRPQRRRRRGLDGVQGTGALRGAAAAGGERCLERGEERVAGVNPWMTWYLPYDTMGLSKLQWDYLI